jgi:8-oxo-dGTP pyrophosphatase MutT (NUDIX family)
MNVAGGEGEGRPIVRHAARIVLLDDSQRILLQRFQERPDLPSFWITPGGGLEPGETHLDALHREAKEELGLTGLDFGAQVWHRCHTFPWRGRLYEQHERFFVARCADPAAVHMDGRLGAEMWELLEMRWWTADEIAAASGRVSFAPRELARYLRELIGRGLGGASVDVGV